MKESKPEWVTMKSAELEKIIIELHSQGLSTSKIGLVLRDKHGIPKAKMLGKRIGKILLEANKKLPSEIEQVESKIKNLENHISKNKHDYTATKSLSKKRWIVNKLSK